MTRVVCFSAFSTSHLRFLVPVLDGLVRAGHDVHVFTEAPSRREVERAGATFHDLYAGAPVDAADATSWPVPVRYVAHAGVFGRLVVDRVRELEPDLVVYETFAVHALVVARALRLPAVNVSPNHAPVPERMVADLRAHPMLSISADAEAGAALLRDVHGLEGAHPLMYYDGLSALLNLYPEPPELLTAEERAVFEPVEFLGCLAPELRAGGESPFRSSGRRKVLVALGTIVWGALADEATRAVAPIAAAGAAAGDEVVVALGGASIAGSLRAELEAHGAAVVEQVDQWAALEDADVLVTHHGLNSTHEAIYHRVPMLSYPFFGDQPNLATRCRDLGLSVPLVDAWRTPLTQDRAARAFAELEASGSSIDAALERARRWELRTLADRPRVIDRVIALAR